MKISGYVLLVTSVTMLTVKDAGNALYEGVRELACLKVADISDKLDDKERF